MSFRALGVQSPLIEKLFLAFPRPRQAFFFDVSPQTAFERKKSDHQGDIAYYSRQRQRYQDIVLRKNLTVISTESVTPEESCGQVLLALGLKEMARRTTGVSL